MTKQFHIVHSPLNFRFNEMILIKEKLVNKQGPQGKRKYNQGSTCSKVFKHSGNTIQKTDKSAHGDIGDHDFAG